LSEPAVQRWDADAYAEHAAFVPALGGAVLELLAPKPGERILDLGCGDGVLTQRLVDAGAIVTGFDPDPGLLAKTAARGIDIIEGDGQRLDFYAEYDAVFSNAALHWMPDHDAVFAGVHRALVPGGRFAVECGGFGNIAAIRTAIRAVAVRHRVDAPDQQNYPTVAETAERLTRAGFDIASCFLIPRPTPLDSGMAAWLETFRHGFFSGGSEGIVGEVVDLLRPQLCDRAGNWIADYVRLRFLATRAKG
jgi:SAM-dependent methyltransferase